MPPWVNMEEARCIPEGTGSERTSEVHMCPARPSSSSSSSSSSDGQVGNWELNWFEFEFEVEFGRACPDWELGTEQFEFEFKLELEFGTGGVRVRAGILTED